MEDILIVSSRDSQAAALWVNYLTTCFNQISKQRNRPPFKVLTVSLEDVVGPGSIPASLEEKMVRVKLQIVIVCPQFLEQVYQHPAPALGKLLQPDRVLAMLLGVEEDSVTEQHRAALITYQQWCRLAVKDQDASFVGDFLEVAMGILAKVLRQNTAHTEKAMFSLLPKKVKEGQNKVIVLLNDPISKEDKIKVSVDKNGERIDVTNVKRRNPFTLHFQMPAFCLEVSMLVNVYVEKNGEPLGCRQVKCESRMRELDQMLRSWDNPLEFMCQTLGFSPGNKEHLDNFLVSALQRNLPPHFNLLHTPTGHPHRAHASPEEYPTLLHFAARFGLEKLSWQLLECPGGEQACEIRNVCELTPAEMAEGAGHTKLANALRGYMQMTELTSMYSYLKIMSEGNIKVTGFPGAEYHHPRPLSETYMIPPSIPRPVMDNYQVPPAARPFNPLSSSPQDTELEGYMEMRPPGPKTRPALDQPLRPSLDFLTTVALPASDTSSDPRSPSPVLTTHSTRSTSRQHLDQISLNSSRSDDEKPSGGSVKKSREQLSQGAQDQLLEIINDFKNNVFTISEVEKLVDSWKNRNDVQQSFKDKQEQLSQMRQEYERLQAQMKEQMKRPTPFDRIRGFFKGKPKDMKETASDSSSGSPADGSKVAAVADNVPLCMRPVSSLSLHSTCSSSSSGRMSTVSGCSGISLGDSGTHSDPEDRKQMITLPYDGARLGKGIANYEIPPAPRPIITQQGRRFSPPRYTPAPVKLTAATVPCTCIEERPPQPMPRPDVPETEFDDGNCYISVGGICGPSQEVSEHPAHLLTNTQDGISETNPTNTEYLSLELETGTGVKTPCSSHKCSALRDYMNVNKRDQGTDEGRSTGLGGSKTGVDDVTPASPCPSDASDLPDYINVTIPAVTSAPPIPVRQPYHTKI